MWELDPTKNRRIVDGRLFGVGVRIPVENSSRADGTLNYMLERAASCFSSICFDEEM